MSRAVIAPIALSPSGHMAMLAVSFPGLVTDGFELGPVAVIAASTRHHLAVLWRHGVRVARLKPPVAADWT